MRPAHVEFTNGLCLMKAHHFVTFLMATPHASRILPSYEYNFHVESRVSEDGQGRLILSGDVTCSPLSSLLMRLKAQFNCCAVASRRMYPLVLTILSRESFTMFAHKFAEFLSH